MEGATSKLDRKTGFRNQRNQFLKFSFILGRAGPTLSLSLSLLIISITDSFLFHLVPSSQLIFSRVYKPSGFQSYTTTLQSKFGSRYLILARLSGIFFFLIILASSSASWAVSANPSITQLQQPDGNVFDVQLKGDEWNNRIETTDGYTIEQDATQVWRYVEQYIGSQTVLRGRADNNPGMDLKRHISKESVSPPSEVAGGGSGKGSGHQGAAPTGNFSGPIDPPLLFVPVSKLAFLPWV